MFGDINPADCSETWEFGRDGKPCYVAGPRDTPRKIAGIMKTLTLTAGAGNFDYIVPVSAEELFPQ